MEPLQSKVRVLEMSQVAPPLGSVITKASFPLTFFDLPLLLRAPPEFLFLYSFPIQINQFMECLLPPIKNSLSLTLQHLYALAGNLTWTPESEKPFISYEKGDSVTLTIAESNASFDHLSGYHARDAKEFNPLVPQLLSSDNIKQVPVLAIQITLFPNSGICLGITFPHAAIDGRTIALFLKSWASVSLLGNASSLHESTALPFYDRTVIKDTNGFEKRYLQYLVQFIHSKSMYEYDCNNWVILSKNLNPPDENQVVATFELSEADITRLKKRVLLLATDHPVLLENDPSRFEIACAYMWICLAKARDEEQDQEGNDGHDEEAFTLFVADYRGRLDPPVPATYFGNCVLSVKVSAKKRDIVGEDGIAVAVSTIRKEIKGLSSGFVKNLEARFSRLVSNNNDPKRYDVVSGSTQFGLYELDFGWGRPKKVEMPAEEVFFAGSSKKDGKGIEISLSRDKKEVDAFALNFANGLKNLIFKDNS